MRRLLPVLLVGLVGVGTGYGDEIRIDPRLLSKERRTRDMEAKIREDRELMKLVRALRFEEATKLYLSKLEKPTAEELLAFLLLDEWIGSQLPEPTKMTTPTQGEKDIADKVAALGHDDFETRVAAQEWLEKRLPESLPAVSDAQSHKDPEIAYRAKLVLKAFGAEKNAFLEIENDEKVRIIVPANLVKSGTRLKKGAEGQIALLADSTMQVWNQFHKTPPKPEQLVRESTPYKMMRSIVLGNEHDTVEFWREKLQREGRLGPEAHLERADAPDFGARHLLAAEWLRNFPPGAKVRIVRTFEDGSPSRIDGVGKFSEAYIKLAEYPDGHRYTVDNLLILLSETDTPFVSEAMTKSLLNFGQTMVRENVRQKPEARALLTKFKNVKLREDESDIDRLLKPSR